MIFKQIYELATGLKTETRRVIKPGEHPELDENGCIVAIRTQSGKRKLRVGGQYSIIPRMYQRGIGTIRIVAIHQERVTDLSDTAALNEGIWRHPVRRTYVTSVLPVIPHAEAKHPVELYALLWNAINTRKGLRWADDPLVWVIQFELLGIDTAAAAAWLPKGFSL